MYHRFLRPDGDAASQRRTGKWLVDHVMLSGVGVVGAMRALGVTWATVAAWEASCKRLLGMLEEHLKVR